jgi:tRNA (guanine-N7-)-methyltransferase
MGQKKLVRFAELETFKHVLQYPEYMAGKWGEWFGNGNSITLELACGKGEYAVGLGRMFPNNNFLGIDQKGNRLWVGAKQCIQEGLTNVGFLRTQIDQIASYFKQDEVAEIWITFPDPQLRNSKYKKRLTHPKYLRLYHQFLQMGGKIHLKTDSPNLFRFTLHVIELYGLILHESTDDLYARLHITPELQIRTHYEQLDIAGSHKIHYCCFSLGGQLMDNEKDALLKEWVFEQPEMK